ncbi:MAG: hypothetical protein JWM21_342 [Acidobacteria bacterium]|nr:hypothetical protein [Acidobacteriota bacterium]
MWKSCPYCRDYSFDEQALLNLTYFKDQPCKSCGKLVRNDGLRQLLLLPAILAGLLSGAVILFIIPPWLTPIGWLLLVIFGFVPLLLLPKPIKADGRVLALFDPDPKNDKAIMVEGWESEQLDLIIAGFIAKEDSTAPHYTIEIDQQREDCYLLTFPDDIHPAIFAALIHYLQYPVEFRVPDSAINIVGRTTLNGAFDALPEELIGERAYLYLPEDDQDFDIVYLQTESGANLSCSLTDRVWRAEVTDRVSLAAKKVMTNP